MDYDGVYEDPDFRVAKAPSLDTLKRLALYTGGAGAVAGLTPTLLRMFTGRRFNAGRSVLEVGGGAALGALIPALSKWRTRYQGPDGEVRSWQDLQTQLGLSVDPVGTKYAAAWAVPALKLGGKWALRGLQAYGALSGAHQAYTTHGEARTAERHGMTDEAAQLRRARNAQIATSAAYLLPYEKMFKHVPGVRRLMPGAVAKAAPGAGGLQRGLRKTYAFAAPMVGFSTVGGVGDGISVGNKERAYTGVARKFGPQLTGGYSAAPAPTYGGPTGGPTWRMSHAV